jgi:hypothetical protein
MNISRRLAKIEEKLIESNPGAKYCDCWKKHLQSVFDSISNEDAGIETEIHPEPDFEKGFCDRCRKPISKEDSVMAQDMADYVGQIEAG